ncbi:trypco2 family protein [Fluviibacter phosphoraccumulans]|uniref:trypco2 family protein n=1 Tax=Fluviibacter phosphoraccumulans TaxID=1751046 RepID=UPI0024E22B3D|nr:trypco2 family protein [Fluviibacter phosphoraccumulans]
MSLNRPTTQLSGMSITAALSQLKSEILALQNQQIGNKDLPMFCIDEGELELTLVARREVNVEGKANGKFKLFVVDCDVSGSGAVTLQREHTQTLRLKFRAIRPSTTLSTRSEHNPLSVAMDAVIPAFHKLDGISGIDSHLGKISTHYPK